MGAVYEGAILTLHRVRDDWFRVQITGVDPEGRRRTIELREKLSFNAVRLPVGDKLEVRLDSNFDYGGERR